MEEIGMEENQTSQETFKAEPIDANQNNNQQNTNNNQPQTESKLSIGVLCGIFLGAIGLVVGLLLYKENTIERQTFIKGWLWAFIISAAVSLVLTIVIVAIVACVPIAATSSIYY